MGFKTDKVPTTKEEQDTLLALLEDKCHHEFRNVSEESDRITRCGYHWDGILCWPSSSVGIHYLACPEYFVGFNSDFNASKVCEPGGVWTNWTNFTQCSEDLETTLLVELGVNGTVFWETYVPLVKFLSELGYGISGITLIFAFIILLRFKRLRCPRNMLHLHLFASFIMRALINFLKRCIFEQGVGPQSDFLMRNGEKYFHQRHNGNFGCKSLTTIWQYFIVANYSWVLMEGLYIHNVIMWALSADSSRILVYIVLGWGIPFVIVAAWAVARALWENDLCWTVHNVPEIQYIIQAPITFSIILNFGLFLNILRLLLSKVQTSIQGETERYWRLARSTLVLVVLFGVPYFALLGLYYFGQGNDQVHLTWLLCDQLFASFQGYIVALLYCFLNGEVQEELKKAWISLIGGFDHTLPTTSHASFSEGLNPKQRKCKSVFDVFMCLFTCHIGTESRSSKRTETLDCIMCEVGPNGDLRRPSKNVLSSLNCECSQRHDRNDCVEMKLMENSM